MSVSQPYVVSLTLITMKVRNMEREGNIMNYLKDKCNKQCHRNRSLKKRAAKQTNLALKTILQCSISLSSISSDKHGGSIIAFFA